MNVIGGVVSSAMTNENSDQRAVNYDHQCLISINGLWLPQHLERVR